MLGSVFTVAVEHTARGLRSARAGLARGHRLRPPQRSFSVAYFKNLLLTYDLYLCLVNALLMHTTSLFYLHGLIVLKGL